MSYLSSLGELTTVISSGVQYEEEQTHGNMFDAHQKQCLEALHILTYITIKDNNMTMARTILG